MRATDDIAPLVDIAEAEFQRLMSNTHTAVNALTDFWTNLYGPNECRENLAEMLNEMSDEFYEVPEEERIRV